ncbi:MAG: type III pantothenate kinase [bacterium]
MNHIQRTLAVEIGNTRVKIGIFIGRDLGETADFPSNEEVTTEIIAFLDRVGRPDRCIISTVVPALKELIRETIIDRTGIPVVRARKRVRRLVPMQVDQPDQVGTDRLVNCLAALRLYGAPSIVVSVGTATTFEILSAEGAYLGGCIIPGVGISKDALVQRTALLPPYHWRRTSQLIGKTTLQHLEIGIYQGTKCMIERMIEAYREELGGQAKSIGTGGYSHVLAEDGLFDVHDPHLSLKGLLFAIEETPEL